MNDIEKQIVKDLFKFVELLHTKVKIHDDFLERVLHKKPDLISQELMAKIEDGNRKLAQGDLAELKNKIQNL